MKTKLATALISASLMTGAFSSEVVKAVGNKIVIDDVIDSKFSIGDSITTYNNDDRKTAIGHITMVKGDRAVVTLTSGRASEGESVLENKRGISSKSIHSALYQPRKVWMVGASFNMDTVDNFQVQQSTSPYNSNPQINQGQETDIEGSAKGFTLSASRDFTLPSGFSTETVVALNRTSFSTDDTEEEEQQPANQFSNFNSTNQAQVLDVNASWTDVSAYQRINYNFPVAPFLTIQPFIGLGIGLGKYSADFSYINNQNVGTNSTNFSANRDFEQSASYIKTGVEIGSNFVMKSGLVPYLKYSISSISYSGEESTQFDAQNGNLNGFNSGFNQQNIQNNENETFESTKIQSVNIGIGYRF